MFYQSKIVTVIAMATILLPHHQSQRTIVDRNVAYPKASLVKDHHTYATYLNDRYHFRVLYPTDVLTLFDKGDGTGCRLYPRIEHSHEITSMTMLALGAAQQNSNELSQQYRHPSEISFGTAVRTITYRKRTANWYVISGITVEKRVLPGHQRIFYSKVVCKGDVIVHLYLEYDKSEANKLKTAVTNISRSFDLPDRQPR